jgi:uncharacterized membrane protein
MLLAFLIGCVAGLRALTAPAAVAWAARLGWVSLPGGLAWLGSTAAVAILTVLAVLELVADKLPATPSRTAPPGIVARILAGGVAGACVGHAGAGAATLGALLGVAGGLAGGFGGYQARTGLVRALGVPDPVIAVLEDVLAIASAFWIVSRV